MASNSVPLVAFFFIFIVASSPIAQGFLIGGTSLNVAEIQALGVLTCKIPGSNIPGNPITNATVAIACSGGTFSVGVTNATGVVTAVLSAVDGLVFTASTCNATITLGNLASCSAYPLTFTTPVVLTLSRIITTVIGEVALFLVSFGIPLL